MTAVVAHPLAALRVLRRAGRRRALRVVFLLGGLLALGFLWGGQAHAVEAPPVPAHDSAAAVVPAQKPVQKPVSEAEQVVREAVAPVADVVRRVARPIGELKDRVAEHRPATPELPAPALPASALPVHEVPVPQVPAGAASSPGGGTEAQAEPVESVQQGSGDRAQPSASDSDGAVDGAASVGGDSAGGDKGAYRYDITGQYGDDASRSTGRADCGAAVPVQAPAGPCGDGVRQATGDGSSSRSGDQHAAAFADGARFGLVRGATLPATAAPTYDRPHQILEFPG